MNVARTAGQVFATPSLAFETLRERPTWAVPLLLLLGCNTVVVLWYHYAVDLAWVVATAMERGGAELTAEQRELVMARVAGTSPAVLGGIAAVAAGAVTVVGLLLWALWLRLVSLVVNDGFVLRHWFALVCWSALPLLLASLASMVNLALVDATYLPAEHLNPLSFASLFGLEAGGRVMQMIDVTWLWAVGLMVVGHARWTGRPLAVSALLVCAPVLLVAVLVGGSALLRGGA